MRLLFIRHGDPNYQLDCLTEKGKREAAILAGEISNWDTGKIYVSPMRRAQQTAAYSLKALGKKAETLQWLHEFHPVVDVNGCQELIDAYPTCYKNPLTGRYAGRIPWDMLPKYKSEHPDMYDNRLWRDCTVCRHSKVTEEYDNIINNFDALLKENGYQREGTIYKVTERNEETLTFFCHLGLTCAVLSHLFNVSPFALWDNICFPTATITELVSEERQQGYANFKVTRMGESAHLLNAGEPFGTSAMFPVSYYRK